MNFAKTLRAAQKGFRLKDRDPKFHGDLSRETGTDDAPWHVIPADRKWFARVAVSAILLDTLKDIAPRYPEVSEAHRRELKRIRQRLLADGKHPKG